MAGCLAMPSAGSNSAMVHSQVVYCTAHTRQSLYCVPSGVARALPAGGCVCSGTAQPYVQQQASWGSRVACGVRLYAAERLSCTPGCHRRHMQRVAWQVSDVMLPSVLDAHASMMQMPGVLARKIATNCMLAHPYALVSAMSRPFKQSPLPALQA